MAVSWVQIDPVVPAPFGALRVEGLRIGDATVTVDVDRDGRVEVSEVPQGFEVRVRGAGA